MRLIDADKLPYAMKDYFDGKKTIGQIIDDAPTIEMAEDCVKRDDAIRLAEQGQIQGFEWQFKQLAMLPSVQPQPKRGKWIDTGMWLEGRKYGKEHGEMIDAYSCDYCGYSQHHKTNFCPNCGVDMREGKLMQRVIELSENATNGDVIKALFPNTTITESEDIVNIKKLDGFTIFTKKWWGAPYKRGEKMTKRQIESDVEPLQKEDVVNHPNHYCTGKNECIDVMAETLGSEAVKDFCICNAFKYIYRHKHKNGVEDIKKAIWYLNKYVALAEEVQDD